MARVKKKVLQNISLEQAQEASAKYAVINNQLQKIEAKMNEEINKIKSKYQDEITELQEKLDEPFDVLETFAKEQQENWGKRKSTDLLHCLIGFRTGTPKVVTAKGWTLKAVTDLVMKAYPNLVRSKVELDKDAIIAMRDEDGFGEIKKSCFLDVVQDETFYVEPKAEELAAV